MLDFAVEIIDLKRDIYFEHSSVGVPHMGELGAMEALDFQRAPSQAIVKRLSYAALPSHAI